MPSRTRPCDECGVPIDVGLARCPNCGAQTGTVFSEGEPPPQTFETLKRRRVADHLSAHSAIERARENANHSLILALASFFPVLGFLMAIASIYLGSRAHSTLRAHNIEEGRGMATAGIIVGVMAILAQLSYGLYFWKLGIGALFGG